MILRGKRGNNRMTRHETRTKILTLLETRDMTSSEMATEVGLKRHSLVQHVGRLCSLDLVKKYTRHDGKVGRPKIYHALIKQQVNYPRLPMYVALLIMRSMDSFAFSLSSFFLNVDNLLYPLSLRNVLRSVTVFGMVAYNPLAPSFATSHADNRD